MPSWPPCTSARPHHCYTSAGAPSRDGIARSAHQSLTHSPPHPPLLPAHHSRPLREFLSVLRYGRSAAAAAAPLVLWCCCRGCGWLWPGPGRPFPCLQHRQVAEAQASPFSFAPVSVRSVVCWKNKKDLGFRVLDANHGLLGAGLIHRKSRVPDARSVFLFFCFSRFLVELC